MNKKSCRIGLDVGSTTAKIAVIDESESLIYSRYERHNAKVGQLVSSYFDDILSRFGDFPASICVTGSVGMHTAGQLGTGFVQEVVAATVYARKIHPEAKVLIDIGGEDAKVVFSGGKNIELRMNGNCAGGTGAFIDQMAVLMGTTNGEMNDMAMRAERVHPMAARCGVFAKTDIQNLMARNIPKEEIAASIFHSIAVQTITSLSHGHDYPPPILLCGGPLTFMPALRKAFANYLRLKPEDFIVSDHSNIIPAMGCALQATGETAMLSELRMRLDRQETIVRDSDLPPLFTSDKEHRSWSRDKEKYSTPVEPMHRGEEKLFIGIDSGSTTTKIIAAREDGTIVFRHYAPNLGSPIKAVKDGLEEMMRQAEDAGTSISVCGSCSTGYGEELIRTAFNLDGGIIETMAHYNAASRLMPDVSFILDIGGQDMKAIFVEDGVVTRMELNEACSSGCGTFLQTFANNLGYSISEFADIACTAKVPCDLGTRCTVFMNSKVKQVMREGASVGDISAGLSYSVIKNCLNKVLKLHDNDDFGKHIVVQGGTMRNDAVVRAFEILTGHETARGSMPELMGAYGCALHAIKNPADRTREVSSLLASASCEPHLIQCKGCENNCPVTQYRFAGGNKFHSGNKCERIFNNHGKARLHGRNAYEEKYALLFDRADKHPANPEARRTIGIPRILNMYEEFPFWHTLLTSCGFRVILSSQSTFGKYESALGTVMSDNICFPAKLVHSHIAELDTMEPERILMPYVVYEHKDDEQTDNSFNCPIVSGYSDVIRSAMKTASRIDSPVINFADDKLLKKQIMAYLKSLGVKQSLATQAFAGAVAAQREYEKEIRRINEDILAESRKRGNITILLAGRPYHTDPLIHHKLSETIASLGADVISDDIVRDCTETKRCETHLVRQWAYTNRIIKAGQWTAGQDGNVHFVQMTSFGCGPDAFIQDEIGDILRRHGKPFTLLKIDDVSNTGSLKLRIRSLVESLKGKSRHDGVKDFPQTRIFKKGDRCRKILAPFFTEYLSPLLPPLLSLAGYDVEILPPSDPASARLGLTYANNEVCYPATLIVGDMVKALKSGKYNPDEIALVMTQTGGQCRATNYTALIKRAMIANGFQDVPLITLGVSTAGTDNEQEGFEFPWLKLAAITTNTLLYCDVISKLYNAAAAREKTPGAAKTLKEKYIRLADRRIRNKDTKGLVRLAAQAAHEFDGITIDKDCPKVGIVGEIFLKFNPFAHQFIADNLTRHGIEVVPPLISPFFLQEFVNIEAQKKLCLTDSSVPNFIVKSLYSLIERQQKKMDRAASAFRYYRPFTNIYEDAKGATGIVSLAAQFGEGWLLPADIVGFERDGIHNVISLQPFGCIANHVISKGIEKKLRELYPSLNLLSLDFDSGVSSVNVINRLLLFLDSLTA